MSEKAKLSTWDWVAISAAACFVLALLSIRPIEKFISASHDASNRRSLQSWHVIEWLTLGVLIFQAWIFLKQAGISERQVSISERQAGAAELQNNISLRQMDILIAQKEIARQGHLAVHRPRLSVRHVWIDDSCGNQAKLPGLTFTDGSPVTGNLIIVNVGGSDAIIKSSEYRIVFLRSDSMPPGVYVAESQLDRFGDKPKQLISISNPGGEIIEPGGSLAVPINGIAKTGGGIPDMTRLRESSEDRWRVFVLGQILYEDRLGQGRFVGFCRQSDMTEGFRPVDDPDYEYQD